MVFVRARRSGGVTISPHPDLHNRKLRQLRRVRPVRDLRVDMMPCTAARWRPPRGPPRQRLGGVIRGGGRPARCSTRRQPGPPTGHASLPIGWTGTTRPAANSDRNQSASSCAKMLTPNAHTTRFPEMLNDIFARSESRV